MAGLGGVTYRPNLCFCGHDLVVHTPTTCSQCSGGNAHAFGPDPVLVQTANVRNNGQRDG